MDFVTTRDNLLKELQAVQGIVEKKSTIPILQNIVIDAKKGRLEFLATDLEVALRTACEASVTKPGSVTVSARRLFDIVRLLPDAEVRLKSEDGHWVTLTCQKSRFRIVGLPREEFPAVPEFDFTQGIVIERALLAEMINKVIFAVTTDEGRYQITGTLLSILKKHVTMVATDGHRLALVSARIEKGAADAKIEVIVPRKAVQELTHLGEGEDVVHFGQKDNHVFFKVGEDVLSATVVPGTFPDYAKVIPEGNDKIVKLESGVFADAVRRVALLSSERSRAVKFTVAAGNLVIATNNPEVGEASETIDVDYSGPSLEVGFNAKYLLEFLQAMGQGPLILALKDEGTQGLLQPISKDEGKQYRYVVMPMHI